MLTIYRRTSNPALIPPVRIALRMSYLGQGTLGREFARRARCAAGRR